MMRGIPTASVETESLRDYFSKLFALLRRRGMQMLVLTTALRSMGQGAMMAFLPVYLREDQGISFVVIGLFMSCIQIVGIFSQPAMGYLADRLGHKAVLVPGTAALGLLMIALKYSPADNPITFDILWLTIALRASSSASSRWLWARSCTRCTRYTLRRRWMWQKARRSPRSYR